MTWVTVKTVKAHLGPFRMERAINLTRAKNALTEKFKIRIWVKRNGSKTVTMDTPSLRLLFVKGPRKGDALEYKLGSTIRVGRIVRGNEIAIKDAGISTKHLWIGSVSGNWVVQDLGSSNGTLLNSKDLDPETPVDLGDGDVIEFGEYTSIVVNFVIDDVLEEKPPRNNRRQANARKRIRVSESSNLDVKIASKPSSRVRKVRKIEDSEKLGVTDGLEKELLVEKKVNFRNVESIQSSCVNSVKVKIEDLTMAEENSGRGVKKIESVGKSCLGVVNVEKEEALKEKRTTRATRSKKIDIVGDPYLELEMVLNQARKNNGKNKKAEHKRLKSFEDDEVTDSGEQDLSCPVEEDMKNELDTDLRKMTLGALFSFLEGHLSKGINNETESMIEPMRSKTQRVREVYRGAEKSSS
ncbi:FHA domain-containing protein At4g14490 [Arabidopsis lyrata subsp. lyrata]|uniref:FHA domain-containing protein At4g14490 n=1 Tax=Arabidopsis lyrata subsp. lyrata TaxID=81972 RepID=UPI000A29A2BF|nr:FHA domain-containing protein At4g14490 [Arabidopsis lyrata subsp. lyrata]|eukprot:XP_020872163.1 FHA domain-containing protein At4g14490 [Arabidopsis lyrata subsp. lyrata]